MSSVNSPLTVKVFPSLLKVALPLSTVEDVVVVEVDVSVVEVESVSEVESLAESRLTSVEGALPAAACFAKYLNAM